MNLRSTLAHPVWLSPERARAYNAALAGLGLAFLLVVGVLSIAHWSRKPVALDFSAFWAASRLAAAGQAVAAYDHTVIEPTERAANEMAPGYLAFYYPPSFLLLILPLGLAGYSVALAAFLAAEMALVLAALRRILPEGWAVLPIVSFPGFLMNGLSGQNGALSAACFAGAALWLERSPLLAGACLGALACKPQLFPCVPVALLSARRWRALAGCACSACGLSAASLLAFGGAAWRAFLANAPLARADIETIAIKWPKMQSVYGAVRLAGGTSSTGYAAQAVATLSVLALLAIVCAQRPGRLLEAASLATAATLFTPFLYDYDLAILSVPLACLAASALRTGWLGWEKLVGSLVFLLPLAARAAGLVLHVTLAPPLVIALMLVLGKRAGVAGRA